ncbi:hypothetical protein FNU77_08595 [Prescottella equi]|uniref:hypothetical protein n=1 Tax=Rhodococcus hoagii TaxID=43767 RepID=UPI001162B87D|nr:hypothetical protein [Prescottella equi]QDP09770.1 hypothetical protein FNU77_08595 [Prescottella equi]
MRRPDGSHVRGRPLASKPGLARPLTFTVRDVALAARCQSVGEGGAAAGVRVGVELSNSFIAKLVPLLIGLGLCLDESPVTFREPSCSFRGKWAGLKIPLLRAFLLDDRLDGALDSCLHPFWIVGCVDVVSGKRVLLREKGLD